MTDANSEGSQASSQDLPNFQGMSNSEIKQEFKNERRQAINMEKDLFKKQTHVRRLETEIKKLQALN